MDFHEVIPSIDDGDLENKFAVVGYVEDIYKFYQKIEDVSFSIIVVFCES